MRVERERENVFRVVATGQELSALVAAARMSLEILRNAPEPAARDGVALLERVLHDFDQARKRLADSEGSTG